MRLSPELPKDSLGVLPVELGLSVLSPRIPIGDGLLDVRVQSRNISRVDRDLFLLAQDYRNMQPEGIRVLLTRSGELWTFSNCILGGGQAKHW